MTDDGDTAFQLALITRDLERDGIKSSARATQFDLRALLVALMKEINSVRGEYEKRIVALEKQTGGMQKALDHVESHALTFRGEWQTAAVYQPGTVVRHRGGVFTALRSILPGKAEPGRNGSGWDRIL
jgi:hypothetical protein